jgi:hypothetical protein
LFVCYFCVCLCVCFCVCFCICFCICVCICLCVCLCVCFLISARISQPIRHFLDDVFSFFYFSFSFEEQKYLRHFNLLSRSTVDLRHAIKKKFLSKLSTFTSNFGLSHFISNLSFIFYFRCFNSPLTETAIYCF